MILLDEDHQSTGGSIAVGRQTPRKHFNFLKYIAVDFSGLKTIMATSTKLSLTSRDTALCIIPPRSQWSKVDQLRSHYDKAYGKWPPHINLVYPFVQPDALPRAVEAAQSAVTQQDRKPFNVCLDAAGVFEHRHDNTVYVHDSDDSHLKDLRAAVLGALGQHDDGAYRSHMTIGQSEDSTSFPRKNCLPADGKRTNRRSLTKGLNPVRRLKVSKTLAVSIDAHGSPQ